MFTESSQRHVGTVLHLVVLELARHHQMIDFVLKRMTPQTKEQHHTWIYIIRIPLYNHLSPLWPAYLVHWHSRHFPDLMLRFFFDHLLLADLGFIDLLMTESTTRCSVCLGVCGCVCT